MKKLMKKIFTDLNQAVDLENLQRQKDGILIIPKKNKQLIRQAIASGKFPTIVDRIIKNNGSLEFFLEDDIE